MFPSFVLFGHTIALYALCIMIGLGCGIWVATRCARAYEIPGEDIIYAAFYAAIGLAVGGKILYLLVELPNIVRNWTTITSDLRNMIGILQGGFVFYGGVFGAILGIVAYAKQFKMNQTTLLQSMIPAVPLVHAFGRIGCFCAGCCYGIPYTGIGHVIFHVSPVAPNEVALFPTQLVEAGLNLIIFRILMWIYKKTLHTWKAVGVYGILYSFARFFLEYLRGDVVRGMYGGLSTSQWIGILIIIFCIVFLWCSRKATKHPHRES